MTVTDPKLSVEDQYQSGRSSYGASLRKGTPWEKGKELVQESKESRPDDNDVDMLSPAIDHEGKRMILSKPIKRPSDTIGNEPSLGMQRASFASMPLEYYEEDILEGVGELLGRFVKIHSVCFHYGRIGHTSEGCAKSAPVLSNQKQPPKNKKTLMSIDPDPQLPSPNNHPVPDVSMGLKPPNKPPNPAQMSIQQTNVRVRPNEVGATNDAHSETDTAMEEASRLQEDAAATRV
ncbi:hypothetical protein Scep_022437 [Stephania cephalantha]|uniref:Uncharacterized protein n=1 Tax=Stephania cephalantha TaxID=152367 RepID=A0AAP0FF46_9MAGN